MFPAHIEKDILAVYESAFEPATRLPWEVLKAAFASGTRHILTAERYGKPAGLAVLAFLPLSRTILLEYLAVAGHLRRRGIGGSLITDALALARRRGEQGLLIEVELDAADTADLLAYYSRFGAFPLDGLPDYAMPNVLGGSPVPMSLLWLPLASGQVLQGNALRTTVIEMFDIVYSRPRGDVLLEKIIAPLDSPH